MIILSQLQQLKRFRENLNRPQKLNNLFRVKVLALWLLDPNLELSIQMQNML